MRSLLKWSCGALVVAGVFAAPSTPVFGQRAGQAVVVEGPLTPDCPFGICPVTNQPRDAAGFYQLFGYLPASAGIPGVRTTPPANWPKTYYTPRQQQQPAAHAAPQVAAVVPRVNAVPRANVVPKANVVPPLNAAPKQAAAPVQPKANMGSRRIVELPAADAARMKTELRDRNLRLLDGLTARFAAAIDEALATLPARLNVQARQELRAAIASGDVAAVRRILGADADAPAGRRLTAATTGRRAIDTLRTGVTDGRMNPAALVDGVDALGNVIAGDVLSVIGEIAVNVQVGVWIDEARPGANPIPAGPNVPIALIPNLVRGTIIPLGNGPTLIGMGADLDRIVLGEGNVLQTAGLPAPDGPPVPDDASPSPTGQVLLTNVGGGPINYMVNGSPFTMQSKYKQNLDAGQEWTIDFDRGNGRGAAQYTLAEGWYEFTPNSGGWELYKKSFEVRLENANDFSFIYVHDNQQRMLYAGETVSFSGVFPPTIRFDDAEGKLKQKQLIAGKYRVALTPAATLEVYPASSIPEPPKPEIVNLAVVDAGGAAASTTSVAGPAAPAAPAAPSILGGDKPAVAAAPATREFTLPAGFHPIDPVEHLKARAEKKVAKVKLPPAFTMFSDTAGGGD